MRLVAEEIDAVCVIRDLATGAIDEVDLAVWIGENSSPFDLDAE